MEKPKPAMRGHYSIRNPAANLLFRTTDALLRLTLGQRDPPPIVPASVRRILISNIAHLGDVIAATAVLPALQDRFPGAEFGFLVGSWSLPVLEGHPLVTRRHLLDHWKMSRAPLPRREKWKVYRRTRRQALREIKDAGYDLSVDLYWNSPNTLPLLWQAGIPIRAGYGSAGLGPLATHCLELSESRLSVSERHRALLARLGLPETSLAKMTPTLPPVSASADAQAAAALEAAGIPADDFLVFHPGAGAGFRKWPEEKWRHLAALLADAGHSIVFTGQGDGEEAAVRRIIDGLPRCVSLCGRLSWPGYVAAVQRARLLVSVDTVAGHVAGAVGTPSAVITSGRYPYLWKPAGAATETLMFPVPCAPCHLNNGCAGMECIQSLEVARVQQSCLRLL